MQRSIANVQIRYREIITLYTVRSVCRIMLTITFPFIYIYIYSHKGLKQKDQWGQKQLVAVIQEVSQQFHNWLSPFMGF